VIAITLSPGDLHMSLITTNRRAGQSQPLTFKVSKRDDLLLHPPVILLAPGNQLPPNAVPTTGLPVDVPVYQGMEIGDMIVMHFGTYATAAQRVNAKVQQNFFIPKTTVDAHADTTQQVKYEVTRAFGGGPVPSPIVLLKILSREICEDFSSAPVGQRYPDNSRSYFPSRLNIFPQVGNGGAANAQIVASASGRELSYYDGDTTDSRAYSYLRVGIAGVTYPLTSPLTVTFNFYLISPNIHTLNFRADWHLNGDQSQTIGLPLNANSATMTIPVGATPSHFYRDVEGVSILLACNPGQPPHSTTVRLTSVCWKQ